MQQPSNFITTNHRGGIGNAMFKLAAAISLAKDNNINYTFSREFIRPGIDPDYSSYSTNILRSVQFNDYLPDSYNSWTEPSFGYTPIVYEEGTNLLLDGYFQSAKYFEKNKQYVVDLFKPTQEIITSITDQLPNISTCSSIHVRRGDYVNLPHHHPLQTVDYYRQAVEQIGEDTTYLIFSDDLQGCAELFNFLPNKLFLQSGSDWMDLYIMSLCKNNIICNSTFSWWGAYLNSNIDKKVVAPTKWFGVGYAHYETSDICPSNWIKI